ncbi:MAG: protein-L-isoaspartate(D-aspartate) O-methyltransferase [Planctomycetota bacterium]
MLEEYDYPETSGRRVYVLLFFLVLLGALAGFFALKDRVGLRGVLVSPDKKADPNQAAAAEPDKTVPEPNKPAAEPNEPTEDKPTEPNEPNDKKLLRRTHKHPAFIERVADRARMVDWQIDARGIDDPNVLMAMQVVPRHAFIPETQQRYAYSDRPLPIGYEQTISQPYIVAFMTEALQLKRDSKVLEIGTGSGYQAAVCSEICREVYTIEIVEELAKSAEECLKELGYRNVFVKAGDGYFGWPEQAPFDAIIGTAAAGRVPEPFIEQLKPGGRMILPYGSSDGFQYLVLITKDKDGKLTRSNVMPVRFVPMTGEVQKAEEEPNE